MRSEVKHPYQGGERTAYLVAKRVFDVGFSVGALVLLSPLMAAVGLAIKLDSPGPAIFKQTRMTKGAKPFTLLKFRSMVEGAEEQIDELRELSERDHPAFKLREDPRATRVGRMIRKTSIDELPQFVNVILGDMSLVGPRPPLPEEVAYYTERQMHRLDVKTGMTCTWQVRPDRDDLCFDEWVDLDLEYIRNRSVLVDLKLMAQTIPVVLSGMRQ